MWKKDSNEPQAPARTVGPDRSSSAPAAVSRVGSGIVFTGDVSGTEDLLVEGRFRGEVQLGKYAVTIGVPGQLEGNVTADSIVVEGKVVGHLKAAKQIIVRATGKVEGNLTAPRVTLHDGCAFQGSIDMPQPNTENLGGEKNAAKAGSPKGESAKVEGRDRSAARRASAQPA